MLTTKMETVTPEKAKNWLSRSKNPRKLKPRHVQDFIRHLNHRTFELTHQGIALDENGYLVDGQHRLAAIVETGHEVDMMVSRGISSKGIVVVDRGQKRDNSVVLRCDPSVAQIITLATKIATKIGVPMEYDLARFKKILEDDCVLLLQTHWNNKRRVSSAPVKLGAVLNMDKHPDWVCAQWLAFNKGDFPNQSPSVQWLYRRVVGDRSITPSQQLVYSFKAFNRENANNTSLTIKNVELNIEEVRKVLRQMARMNPDVNGTSE